MLELAKELCWCLWGPRTTSRGLGSCKEVGWWLQPGTDPSHSGIGTMEVGSTTDTALGSQCLLYTEASPLTYSDFFFKKGCNVQLLKSRGATFPRFELWLPCLPTTWYCGSHTQLAGSQNKISSILLTTNRWQESLLIYYLPLDFWWTAVFLWNAFRNPVHRYRSRHIGRAPFIAYYSWLTIRSHWLQWFPKWVPLSTRVPQWTFKSLEREREGRWNRWVALSRWVSSSLSFF